MIKLSSLSLQSTIGFSSKMLIRATDAALAGLIPAAILLHLVLSPYTKVEESFGLQATHDILTYGIPWFSKNQTSLSQYDHVEFSGSVPRTFLGPLALAGASWPWLQIFKNTDRQIVVRAILGLFNAICLLWFRSGVVDVFGRGAANWFVVFTASQFHLMYYASRTLPNFFAFGLTTVALHDLLPLSKNLHSEPSLRRYHHALTLLTAVGVIFRSELALLLGSHTLYLLIQRRIEADPFEDILPFGILGAVLGLGISVPIDSYFWQKFPIWPELTGFLYNFVSGKSQDWGVSPFYFYFLSSLPRLLFNPMTYMLCIPITFALPPLRKKMRDILFPNLFFIFLYSFQAHKEWRFIVYVIPPVTAVAAAGASWVWTRRGKTLTYRFLSLALVASVFASFATSFCMLFISRLNYPGADALIQLHQLEAGHEGELKVHMDILSCMTGVTRFLQQPSALETGKTSYTGPIWQYDKTEDEETLLRPEFWLPFDYALAEEPERVIGKWEIVGVANGYSGIQLVKPQKIIDHVGSTSMERILAARNTHDLKRGATDLVQDAQATIQQLADSKWREGLWQQTTEQSLETSLGWIRRHVAGGYGIEVKMQPRINILRQVRSK